LPRRVSLTNRARILRKLPRQGRKGAWLVITNGNNPITEQRLKELLMSATQDIIDRVTAQLGKAQTEITGAIDDLKAQIAAGVTPDLSALEAAAQALDDVVPDELADEG